MAITQDQFREALERVNLYNNQINTHIGPDPSKPGCRVQLSEYGLQVDAANYPGFPDSLRIGKRKGKILDFIPYQYGDGVVTIKWDGISFPESRHIHQVRPVDEKPLKKETP